MADIVAGTYDFIGNVVRLVRDANLTLGEVNNLRRAAQQARQSGRSAEDFAAANPTIAPIVRVIVQQDHSGQALAILIAVLLAVVGYLQAATYHADEQRAQPARPPQTTIALSDRQVARIEQQVIAKMETRSHQAATVKTKPPTRSARKKRPPKEFGKNKKKRHR
ncbi:MAG: hypothetical protein ACTHMY_06250 [Solirubrobacteraceae bacterium]